MHHTSHETKTNLTMIITLIVSEQLHASLCFLSGWHARFIGGSHVAPFCKTRLSRQGHLIIVFPSSLNVASKIIKNDSRMSNWSRWLICQRPSMAAFLSSVSPSAALSAATLSSAPGSSMLLLSELLMERESNPTIHSLLAVPSWKRPRRAFVAF